MIDNKTNLPNEDPESRSVPDPAVETHDSEMPAPRPSRWRAVRFAVKAVEIRLRFIAVLVGIGLVIGYWDTIRNHWDKWTRPESSAAELSPDSEFYCPMHPNVVRPGLEPNGAIPGCPICGMPLSKRKKGEAPELPAGVTGRVHLSPERVRMAGIATVPISYRPLEKQIRTVGHVAYDESRLSQIVTRFGGYIEELYVDKTYAMVKKDEPLARIYSPELYAAAEEFRIAHESGSRVLIDSSHQKLRLLGISEKEIGTFHGRGKADATIAVRSPRAGQVIRKHVVDGSRIETGMSLFEVADLSVVWIEAEVYEKDVPFLRTDQPVEATVESLPGRVFPGKVSLVYPEVSRQTRTVRVRFVLQNESLELRPGMYATVTIAAPVSELEPFRSQIAARQVKTGATDAELIAAQQRCPVTGAPLGSMGAPVKQALDTASLFLCCQGCIDDLKASPDEFLAKIAPPPTDAVLTVPERAVIDTGAQQVVYVEREAGTFEGVEVKLGPRTGDVYPVLSGLLPGDRVAAAGAFLIDAETRLNPAAASAYFGASGGPNGGESAPAPRRSDESPAPAAPGDGGSHQLTSKERQEVDKLPLADRKRALDQLVCPVTDLHLGSMGVPIKVAVGAETVFICCAGCKDRLLAEPQKYLAKLKTVAQDHVH
ncbi:MAG: efflux RND transporter periplasmic adaptor subunit [Planctomycetales bacterium]